MAIDFAYRIRLMGLASAEADFDVRIRARPDQRDTRHPIFAVERLAGALVFFGRQNPRGGCKLRARDLSTERAGRDSHLGIIAQALRLSHIAASHHVELATVLPKPHWSWDAGAILAERGERDIFLILDRCGDLAWHKGDCRRMQINATIRSFSCH